MYNYEKIFSTLFVLDPYYEPFFFSAKNKAIKNMLDEDFIEDIIQYTMSQDEAKMRIEQFLK